MISLVVLAWLTTSTPSLAADSIPNASQTAGCKKTGGKKSALPLEFIEAARLFFADQDKFPYYIVPDAELCLKDGESHSLTLMETGQVLGSIELDTVGEPITLATMFEDVKLVKSAYPDVHNYLDEAKPHFSMVYPETKDTDKLQVVKFGRIRPSDNPMNPFTSVFPKVIRNVKTVDYAEVAKMVATQKPLIVDTRTAVDFKKWHLPGAQNFPVLGSRGTPLDMFNYRRLKLFAQYIDPRRMPTDKNAPILVTGFAELDSGAYFAVQYLRFEGYKNIAWYRGGKEDWLHEHRLLPDGKAPGDVDEIAGRELAQNLSKYNLVDVRSAKEFRRLHIPGAVNAYYYSMRVPPPYDEKFATETFAGDTWPTELLPKDKAKTIILIGEDEADWQAVIATRRAQALGYKALWYRGGAAEWMTLNRWYDAKRFPLEMSSGR